mmetsp:Transcript_2678/g.5066  ORF Transcript_2678/g.5066 Transcript_2678/m.5066 type:complete len:258 (+) Transcript_2678:273-1046(+)
MPKGTHTAPPHRGIKRKPQIDADYPHRPVLHTLPVGRSANISDKMLRSCFVLFLGRATLTSAAPGGSILPAGLGNGHSNDLLRARGMDPHRLHEFLEGHPPFHRHAVSLHHLPGLRSEVMYSEHFVGALLHDNLGERLDGAVVRAEGPFQRSEAFVVHLDLGTSVAFLCRVFREAHAAVFDGRKDGGADVFVVHGGGGAGKESTGEGQAGFDGDRGQLRTALHDVADTVHVGNASLLELGLDFSISLESLNTYVLQS